MIVDTNVLIRSLGAAEDRQSAAVRARIARARTDGVTHTVLSATVLETAYVLASAAAGYGWERVDVAAAVTAITAEPAFEVEHASALRTAADTYRARSIDLHDCFLAAMAAERAIRVLSFDDDFRRLGVRETP
jgi:predicted nucleic-acid-binding protein